MIPREQLNSRHYGELIGCYTEEKPAGAGSVRCEVRAEGTEGTKET
jgi:hypothetical protein